MSRSAGEAVEIRPYRPGDEAAIEEGFHRVFGVERPAGEWAWKLPPAVEEGGRRVTIATAGGEVVAHMAAQPVRFVVDGRQLLAGHVVDAYSRPRAGLARRGVFARTVETFFATHGGPGGLAFVYGFPGTRHMRLGRQVLGYVDPRPVPYRVKDLAAEAADGPSSPAAVQGARPGDDAASGPNGNRAAAADSRPSQPPSTGVSTAGPPGGAEPATRPAGAIAPPGPSQPASTAAARRVAEPASWPGGFRARPRLAVRLRRLLACVRVDLGFDPAALDDLWRRAAHRYPVAAVRDARRAAARFTGRPGVDYLHLVARRRGRPAAWAAARLEGDLLRWADLLWDGASPAALAALEEALVAHAHAAGCRRGELWLGGDPAAESLLAARGWHATPHPQRLEMTSVGFLPDLDTPTLVHRAYVTLADSDLV